MVQHVRTWSNDAHVSLEYIEKLWKLIYVGFSHKVSESKLSWVVFGSLSCICILVDMHGTELQTLECITVETSSCLSEEYRSRTLYLDDDSYNR